MYILDTNICIYLIKNRPTQILKRLRSKPVSEVAISSITLSELYYGVEKSQFREKNTLALQAFLAPLAVLPFGGEAAQVYGKIRARLEARGKTIGSLDMMIAAHALSLASVLVTNNTREFVRVTGLKLENWTEN